MLEVSGTLSISGSFVTERILSGSEFLAEK
jgi:hypothetical protein